MSNRRLNGEHAARAAMRGKKRDEGPLKVLHDLFLDVQAENVKRGGGGTPAHRSDRKWAKRRAALRRQWKESEPQRRASVAACPRCPEWFPTVAERNDHRTTSCEKRPKEIA